jgi:acetate---CoA ligase (ADP-forming)
MQTWFEPRSVVLIGVSRQSGVGAYNNLEMLIRYGYSGQIYVVHPKVAEILGHKTFAKVTDLPEVPDMAVISVGRERVLPVFEECAQHGIRKVVVISQGFADADERGKELQEQLFGMARKHGTRILGPNTMGIFNAFAGFSTAFIDLARDPNPPPLTLVAQSGVFQVGFESFSGRLGKALDVGNACDLDFSDALDFLEHDPQTEIIVLHMEGIRGGRRFLETAARVARSKPIIVLKTGRSIAGARAALSHTGSLVGEDAVVDAAFNRAGLIRVRTMMEMRAVCQAFLHFRTMAGPSLAVITATGACGIMTADACEDYGLELAPFPEGIRSDLENAHIAWHKLNNPVDVWPLGMVTGSFTNVFKNAARGLLRDDRVHALLGIVPALSSPLHADLDLAAMVREIQAANPEHKPIALWLYADGVAEKAGTLANEPGVACFGSIDEAVMGLAALNRYRRFVEQAVSKPAAAVVSTHRPEAAALVPKQGLLVGEAALEVLRNYQVPGVPGELAIDVAAATAIAARLAYPVVLKIVSPQWLHKSDLGGVRLNISNSDELVLAFDELLSRFHRQTPSGELQGILVQKQIRGIEVLMGIKRDPQLGPVIVAGMGGIYTEIFRDVARCLTPIDSQDALEMLQSLRIYPILKGVRGQSGVNLDALVKMLLGLSQLAVDCQQVIELDLNPVMAAPEGCWCVDARIVLGEG